MEELKRKDESGFTLIEFLITTALMVMALALMADSARLQSKTQTTASSEAAITSLFDQVQGIASAEWSCTAGLAGSNYNGAILVKDPVNLATVAAEGTANGAFWTLALVRLQNVQGVPGQPGVLRGNLFLQANKNMALNVGVSTLTRTVPDIYFETNPDGTIARCYTTADTTAAGQSACQLLGGTWTANGTSGSQCQLPVAGG